MQFIRPKIFMIAVTEKGPDWNDFLTELGVPDWQSNGAPSFSEELVEASGRLCYKAFQTETIDVSEMNPNLSKVREGNDIYIGNILKSKHGSVIEHPHVSFAILRLTRVATHELVRHRLCNFSQESLRFVRPTSLDAYFPNVFNDLSDGHAIKTRALMRQTFEYLEDIQSQLVDILGMSTVKRAFSDKKKLQSAFRRMMPIGMCTNIVVTSNHRNWRHMIEMSASEHSEEEIKYIFDRIAFKLHLQFPNLYQDMDSDGDSITFENSKI